LGTVGAKPNEGLELLLELLEANKVMPVIDRTYPLGEVPDAFRYFGEGHVKGKVVNSI
jgi:NADPH:quinone reductase-like Zn-dependent oxidoreductase